MRNMTMKLFDPIIIGGVAFKNRVVFPAMGIGSHTLGTGKSAKIIDFWTGLAKGGAGAVVLGAVAPSSLISDEDLGQSVPADAYFDDLSRIADCVRKAGARFGVQLWHTSKYPSSLMGPLSGKQEWVAPSSRTYKASEKTLVYMPQGEDISMRALSVAEIRSIVNRFAKASVRIQEAGADFVEIHLAHGHLPNQFFSPITNRRTDAYGGDLAGRMRFGIESVTSVRLAVGDDFPVFVRFAAEDEPGEGGAGLDESIVFATELERVGADCLDVSVGISGKTSYSAYCCPTKKKPMGTYAHLAMAIKGRVSIPVVAVGRINTSDIAEEILQKGQADLVAIGRQLVCDPLWPQKVAEGRPEEIVSCDSCNTFCWGVGLKGERPKSLCRKTEKLR